MYYKCYATPAVVNKLTTNLTLSGTIVEQYTHKLSSFVSP